MKIIYEADDGTQFDNEFDCADYEWHDKNKNCLNLIEFYDFDGIELKDKMTAYTYDNAWTIIVPNECAINGLHEVSAYYGYSCYQDIDEPGVWEWDNDELVFRKLSENEIRKREYNRWMKKYVNTHMDEIGLRDGGQYGD